MANVPVHPETFEDLEFPSKGIDLSREISAQIPGTTPIGHNVRLNEPLTLNARGGSRSGLSKYIPAFVNGTSTSKIQDLNYIAIVDSSAVGNDGDGGGGFQKVKNKTRSRTPFWRRSSIQGVQKKIIAYPESFGPFDLAFDDPVTAGSELICIAVVFSTPTGGNTLTVTDSMGHIYTQVEFEPVEQIGIFRVRATSSGPCTIHVAPLGLDLTWFVSIAILEYRNMNSSSPVTGSNSVFVDPITNGSNLAPGLVTVTTASSRIIAAYTSDVSLPGYTAVTSGLTQQLKVDGSDAADVVLFVYDGTFSSSTNPTVQYNSFIPGGASAVGAAFKPA